MKKVITISLIVFLLNIPYLIAQNGIGTVTPDISSRLDISSTTKGILIPRIDLSSLSEDIDGISGQATGLMIFNSGTNFTMGFYYWDGITWKTIDNRTAVKPEITGLSCTGVTFDPSSFIAGSSYVGVLKVPYTGGNGGAYKIGTAIASTGNTGLTATLKASELEYGNGTLIYDVVGTPSSSSPIGANFALNFGTTTPQSCITTVGEVSPASILVVATLGPLVATNDNGFAGYHRMLSTPDGKFSVRVFVRNSDNLSQADLQIRSNNGTQTIMWNGSYAYQGGASAASTNALVLPIANVWYGNNGANSDAALSSNNAAWGDPDVYYVAPEQRSYMWTTANIADQTLYMLKFMMGAPSPNTAATGASAGNTKAFLQIEQIKSGN
jgi:hypothetical protein